MSNRDAPRVTRNEPALRATVVAVVATVSALLWIQMTQSSGDLPVSASFIPVLMWLGFFFVSWPATGYVRRLTGNSESLQMALAFLPVGLLFLVPGAWLNCAQYRLHHYERLVQQSYLIPDQFASPDGDQRKAAVEISAGASLSAYVKRIRPDGALPLGIQRALDAIAAHGTPAQRHEIATVYTSDYNLMRTIASAPQAEAQDLRTIFEYYNNSYAYQPRAELASPHRTVLMCLAKNPRTPEDILAAMLAGAESETVMDNPNLPGHFVAEILERKSHSDISDRASTAASRHATEAILLRLASDPESVVRVQVARNPRTSGRVLVTLLQDEDPQVAGVAGSILYHRIHVGDSSVLHAMAASRSHDYQMMIAVACQEKTAESDLKLIYRQFGSHPSYTWVHDSLVKCLDEHPNTNHGRLLSLLH